MPIFNGGRIGSNNDPTTSLASGLWTGLEQCDAIRREIWPGFAPSIVTDGLVLHLDAGDTNSYPGSGTTWTDLSGNGRTGTLVNGVGYNGGNGGSLSFDGVDDNVNCGSSIITGNNSFSWGCWIKPTSGTAGTPLFLGTNSSGQAMVSYWDYSNNKVHVGVWGSDKLTSGTTILPSTWGHTFWTWNGSTLTSYTNGVSDGNATGFSFNISSSYTRIGSAFDIQYFNGNIAQVSIYNRALTDTEIQQNFNALKGRYGL